MTEARQAAHNAVEFDKVNIVFGDAPQAALPLMDQGLERGPIKAETGQVLGVHDCSLTVREGEILVLMGLSGSGKSTLLRAVNGLNPVCRGEVRIWDGKAMASVTKASGTELRRLRRECIAMVFQQFGLLPWRSVRENVGLGLELAGIPAAERRRRVDAQLATVGLADWAERKVGDLSGGMQQRVGLARAFATEAPILLMDEPFSALDPLIRNRLQDELLELQQRFRRTIIFVSHDLDEAFRIGNRIALMEGGRIVQVGTAREIIAHPANAYVEDFVAHMNPLAVLRAEDMAEPGEAAGLPIDRQTPVREVIRAMTETGAEMLPLQGGGRVTRQGIMSRLVVRRGQAGGALEQPA
ncbi:choline ABC transporter ATP-binding protein [Paracoccus sp. P2]|uniref:Choline ABC transporter ATP-binding protein n=1 Tax=Paracoccus pantotrophus TaxID=82367 RepID=A0A1I5CDV6_PARPN|nr:choline ABC transporter ATP-binding protein [Paracoccus pantotrophus]MDF3852967.1 choline ABC transporter ATP-binding protein [Paracoccus pantotrophus]QFG35673.1 choline ABC transporter ATP-binding protein [Paracoccus pantotrophus]QLH13946.1 choline ABC transporter ATP-binding protein [Paracoccus pantotrophus]RDE00967.1 choline ABC transporter ATP-binding protein [Paracoccus pantotrophus]RKS44084.1 glycine betaine/proline transport system ATP-binding protein [Paracoccus pantotrophus]